MLFSDWIRYFQEADENISSLRKKGIVAELNGMLATRGRQDLTGNEVLRVILPKELTLNAIVGQHDLKGHYGVSKCLMALRDLYLPERHESDQ
jgi:hypothetical protein